MKLFTTLAAALVAGSSFLSAAPVEATTWTKHCGSYGIRIIISDGYFPFASNVSRLWLNENGTVTYFREGNYLSAVGKWKRSGKDLLVTNPDGSKVRLNDGAVTVCDDWYSLKINEQSSRKTVSPSASINYTLDVVAPTGSLTEEVTPVLIADDVQPPAYVF